MERPLLSVCMIVRNEEKMLPECLESLRATGAELIIVDTGSTDSTATIATNFGAQVIQSAWANDFAASRNVALSAATGRWILSIDADERLMNPQELLWVISNAAATVGGYLVNLSSHNDSAGQRSRFVSQLLRLFRNDPRIRFRGRIHEQIIDCLGAPDLQLAASNIEIEHHGYNLSQQEMHDKQVRNLHLLDAALRDSPDDAYMLQQRAKTWLAMKNLDAAETDTKRALQFARAEGTVRPQALNYGAVIAFQRGDVALAIARAEESLRIVPKQAFAYYILGESYTAQQKFREALSAYIGMQDAIDSNDVMARVVGAYHIPPEQLAFCLGRSYLACGRQSEAQQSFEYGLLLNDNDVACRIGLANCEMNNKQFDAARALLEEALKRSPERNDIQGFLTRLSEVEQQHRRSEPQATGATNTRPLISLCMIVKNEEHTLRACLESVRGVADEIVIVDTGSTDETIAIAEEFSARMGHFAWIGDFAAARNEALKLCTGEWIVYLDADERLSAESAPHLRELLSSLPEPVGGVICTIVSAHRQADANSEVHRGGYPRVFKNYGYPRVQFRGRVHEQITPSLLECGAHIVNADIEIIHTGYDVGREEMEKKVTRNYQLLIKHVQEEPLNAYAWFQLGQTLGRMNMNEKAEQSLKFAWELGTLSTPVAATTASTLAHICGISQRYADALYWADQSLMKVPHQIMALNYKAYALMYLHRLDEAEECFHRVFEMKNNPGSTPEAGYEVELNDSVVRDGLKRIAELRGELVVV